MRRTKSGCGLSPRIQYVFCLPDCDGGGQLIAALSAQIDEWTLSVVPTLLGDGIPLFPQGRPSVDLEAVGAASYESGLIQLRYRLATKD